MKIFKYLLILIISIFSFFLFLVSSSYSSAPSIDNIWKGIWYNLEQVKANEKLENNIKKLFFPSSRGNWWTIWNSLRIWLVWLLILFFIRAGLLFVLKAWDEWELKKAKTNLLYIFYGAFLIFWATWILWTVLNVWWHTSASSIVEKTKWDILVGILIFFKNLAYYAAFIMVTYYWYKLMQAQEKEDKIKAWKNGILNVIIALIAIKVLDYLYYIAQQSDFRDQAQSFLSSTWKLLWWVLGSIIIFVLIYAGVLLVTSRWNEEAWKKAKNIIRNVFLIVFIIFLFIVIVYDITKNLNKEIDNVLDNEK